MGCSGGTLKKTPRTLVETPPTFSLVFLQYANMAPYAKAPLPDSLCICRYWYQFCAEQPIKTSSK
jgi:hypothetical protein